MVAQPRFTPAQGKSPERVNRRIKLFKKKPAGRPHFNLSPNPRGTQELKLLIENLLIS